MAITRRPFDGSHDYHIIARCRIEAGPISSIPLSIDLPSGVGETEFGFSRFARMR
jgi:hypothetical protein